MLHTHLSQIMELSWLIFLTSLSLCFFIKPLLGLLLATNKPKLPPGPTNIPIISTLKWFRKSVSLEPILHHLSTKHGPIFTLQIGSRKSIFISSPELAHQALITHGSTFADRPPAAVASRYFSSNQHNITSAGYGPLWRLLRRNLTSEILHPSRAKSYAHARKWALDVLVDRLRGDSDSGSKAVRVMDHFQYAMFSLLVFMCFGEKLDDGVIREIESVQRELLLNFSNFNILNFFPKLGKILFRKRWNMVYQIRNKQESIFLPLIRARKEKKKTSNYNDHKEEVVAYIDTIANLSLLEEGGRNLNEFELVGLCSEFLNAGTDTTSTALQWIIANIVKHQHIQVKLIEEINRVSTFNDEIEEENLQNMPYLKAVVLEGLRRHPPAHFVLPHAVTEGTRLDGYDIPKDATINFMIAKMGMDPKVWEEPTEFKPERFIRSENKETFDITGSREIKMMPFGAGRRICPASGLAMLHLEYFVANLVKVFEWTAEKGDNVDLSEKQEFTHVMKNPLRACIKSRQC